MSKTNDTNPVIVLADPAVETNEVVEKLSRRQKAVNFVKTHKGALIAGALGLALVGGGAALGRSTAPSNDIDSTPDPEDEMMAELEAAENDTVA